MLPIIAWNTDSTLKNVLINITFMGLTYDAILLIADISWVIIKINGYYGKLKKTINFPATASKKNIDFEDTTSKILN